MFETTRHVETFNKMKTLALVLFMTGLAKFPAGAQYGNQGALSTPGLDDGHTVDAQAGGPDLLTLLGLDDGHTIMGVDANNDTSSCDFITISKEDGDIVVEESIVPFAKDGNSQGSTTSRKVYADFGSERRDAEKSLNGKHLVKSVSAEDSGSGFQFDGTCEIDIYKADGTNIAQSVDKDGNFSGPTEFK